MRRILAPLAGAMLLIPTCLRAQAAPHFELKPLERPAEPGAVPLYPAGSLPAAAVPERWGRLIASFPDGTRMDARIARNVSIPEMTPVLPDAARATGAAVVIAPGGAFLSLSMDSEGFAQARWFADHGIAAFVLKYRLNPTPAEDGAFMAAVGRRMGEAMHADKVPDITEPRATLDALRALQLVREGAARWHVDPERVGIMGFSAGAMTALQSVLAGQGAARPAFLGYIYGPMTAVSVPAGAPPMFAALALDDPLFGRQGFGIVDGWRRAGGSVELHAYQRGDHGFGMGRPGTTSVMVMDEFRLWLATNGFLQGRSGARR